MAGAVLVGLGCGEGFLRLQEPFLHLMARRYNYVALNISDPIWDHGLRPGITLSTNWIDSAGHPPPMTYSTNNIGCRYPVDLQVPKPSDVRRILLLGDSFALGYYYEDTVAAQIEHSLNSAPLGKRFEVVNCAVPSHSPMLYYLRLKNQLAALQPDEVLLCIDPTDIFDDYWRYRPRGSFAADGEPLAVKETVRWRHWALEWVLGRLYLARVLWTVRVTAGPPFGRRQATDTRATSRKLFDYYSTLPVTSEEWQREVGFCLENISRIFTFCEERSITVTVTLVPHKEQLQPDANGRLWNREFDQRLDKLCRDAGVDFYSPAEALAAELSAGHSLYLQNDMHFTPAGERIWAGLVANFFVTRHEARLERGRVGPPVSPPHQIHGNPGPVARGKRAHL